MALQAKVIRGKIRAVKNVKKITKAMEKVSAAKMRRSVSRAISAREYAFRAYELLANLLKNKGMDHPFFKTPKGGKKKTLVIAIASNRGLCGAFNSHIARKTAAFAKEYAGDNADYIIVGKKIESSVRRLEGSILASFVSFPTVIRMQDARPISQLAIEGFSKGKYSKVSVIYTHFVSALSYKPIIKQLLPIDKKDIYAVMQEVHKYEPDASFERGSHLFEPTEGEVLKYVLPRIIEIQLYQALLESEASEHSARMIAMKNASENAQKIIEALTVGYNQARQAGITREIAEIAAGAGALQGE